MTIDYEGVGLPEDTAEPRCPCILLLDTSSSMSHSPITELNIGIKVFEEEIKKDTLAASRVEVAIVTFGPVKMEQDFVTVNQFTAPALHAAGSTPTGAAINFALDRLDERKQFYKANGMAFYRPWIFLITDGAPTDHWEAAASRVHEADSASAKKVAFFVVGVEGANMQVLEQITPRTPLRLKGLAFREMFVWLSSSLRSVSHSTPGDEVPLQTPAGWAMV